MQQQVILGKRQFEKAMEMANSLFYFHTYPRVGGTVTSVAFKPKKDLTFMCSDGYGRTVKVRVGSDFIGKVDTTKYRKGRLSKTHDVYCCHWINLFSEGRVRMEVREGLPENASVKDELSVYAQKYGAAKLCIAQYHPSELDLAFSDELVGDVKGMSPEIVAMRCLESLCQLAATGEYPYEMEYIERDYIKVGVK